MYNSSYKLSLFSGNPDTVSLIANVTENTNCSDLLWVNFTYEVSEANPPVQSYQLLKNGEHLDTASNGMWTRQISEAGKHVFSCMALHFLGNVNSFNSLTVILNGKFNLKFRFFSFTSKQEKRFLSSVFGFVFHLS